MSSMFLLDPSSKYKLYSAFSCPGDAICANVWPPVGPSVQWECARSYKWRSVGKQRHHESKHWFDSVAAWGKLKLKPKDVG